MLLSVNTDYENILCVVICDMNMIHVFLGVATTKTNDICIQVHIYDKCVPMGSSKKEYNMYPCAQIC